MGPLLERLRRLTHRLRRRVLLHRRPLAALAAALAVWTALQAAAAPPAPTVGVWTARRDLAGGTRLGPSDLRLARYAPGSAPGHRILSPADAVGRTLAAPVARGEPLTSTRLVSGTLLRGYPGLAGVPVRLTDPAVAGLLRVGDRVSLVAADAQDGGRTTTIASGVPVLALPRPAPDDASSQLQGRLVVVGVEPGSTEAVAAAGLTSVVTAVWTR